MVGGLQALRASLSTPLVRLHRRLKEFIPDRDPGAQLRASAPPRISSKTESSKANARRQNYIDLLRGFFIFVIIADHIARWPSGYEFITGKGSLWVSAAEGFFIISGMMVGMIRGREWLKKGWDLATKKLWLRAAQLYVIAVSLTLAYTALAGTFENSPGVKDGAILNDSFGSIFLQAATGQYVYGWSDFLIYYAAFLFLAPLALWALTRGWWLAVVAASTLVYALGHGHFGMMWQPLFFGGLLFGFYLPQLQKWWSGLDTKKRQFLLYGTFAITAITVILSTLFIHFHIFYDWYQQSLQPHFERWYYFGIGRLVLAPFWFMTIFYLFRHFEDQINRLAGQLLMPLGRNALSAYTFHAVFVFIIDFALPKSGNLVFNFVLVTLVIFIVWNIVIQLSPFLGTAHKRMQALVIK